jgi:hypothetical protein
VVGGAASHLGVEAHSAEKRAERLEDKLTPGGDRAPRPPPSFLGVAWWWWLSVALYGIFRNRSHLLSFANGRESRKEAILRTIGWRTHKSAERRKGGDS